MTEEIEVSADEIPVTTEQESPDQAIKTEPSAEAENLEKESTEPEDVKPEKGRAKDRINELTKQKHELKRENDDLKQRLELAEGIKRDLLEFEAEKVERKIVQVEQSEWQAKQAAAKIDLPDYDNVVGKSTAHVEHIVGENVKESDMAPELFYHLAKNPDVLEKLNSMTEKQVIKEVARLELMLEGSKKADVFTKKISSAPEPITPVSSQRSAVHKSLDDPTLSHKEYMERRRLQGAKY